MCTGNNWDIREYEAEFMRIFLVANSGFAIYNFRQLLIQQLLSSGYNVYVICPRDVYAKKLAVMGAQHLPLVIRANSWNPFREFLTFLQVALAIIIYRPDVCFTFTIKLNLYVGLTRHFVRFKFIPNVTGLGDTFDSNKIIFEILRPLLKLSFSKAFKVFFQNESDQDTYKKYKIICRQTTSVLPGSGIDIKKFEYNPKQFNDREPFIFLFIGRLLKKKGISEYLKAALKLKDQSHLKFYVVGKLQMPIPGLSTNEIEEVMALDSVCMSGFVEDTSAYYRTAHCVVLPSYYNEGVPKVLIEALVHGCLIITTDRPGCRDVIDHSRNGFLCKEQDFEDLCKKMILTSNLSLETLQRMSSASRKKAYLFDEQIVVAEYMKAIKA